MTEQGGDHRVFISFTTSDSSIADKISARLARDRIGVWQYSGSSQSGSWHLNQIRVMQKCRTAIFIITPASSGSAACLDEAERVANPNQSRTIPIPVVVGQWDHQNSDLWLLLNKWNGVMTASDVSESDLHRLAALVHGNLGTRAESSLSTGQALVAVKEDLCSYLTSRSSALPEEIAEQAHKLQQSHRGNMISFLQFTKLDRELRAAALIENHAERLDYVSSYLDSFFKGVVSNALANLAARVAQRFEMGETVVISEYSRVIKEALKVLRGSRPAVFTSIRFLVVSRTGMLLVNDEPIRMIEELRKLGAEPEILTFGDWLGFLSGGSQVSRIGRVDKVLFGVEAFSVRGDVVYPQIVKEVDILRTRKTLGGPISKAIIMAVGEAYKVCRDDQEISRIIVDPYYTVMPSVAFDEIITDIGETQPELSGSTDLTYCARHVEDLVDEIRRVLWPKGTPLPVWNLPSHLRSSVRLIATDIDGTLTSNGSLGLGSLVRIAELAAIGIRVVLVTGRSAGWGYALSQYLPGVLAVVAENGAVLISQDYNDGTPTLLDGWTGDDRQKKMTDVAQCAHAVRQNYPFLTMSPDNFCRLTDIAFLLDPRINPDVVSEIARRHGVSHTFSSVHHHLSASELKKSTGLVLALTRTFDVSETELRESSLTVGDSVNDAPLFDSAIFAATVGVRGILPHLDKLAGSEPMYVTLRDASDGFIELTDVIMEAYQKVVLKM